MRTEFAIDQVTSTEFCVSINQEEAQADYLVPIDRSVQNALTQILQATVRELENTDDAFSPFELSEKYGTKESLVASLASEEMTTIKALYEEEGWPINPSALNESSKIAFYFAVFRDAVGRKLLGVHRATQFKGLLKSRLIRLLDDSLRVIDDHVFRLANDFDFLVTSQNIYILHPAGFESVAEIEEFASAMAQRKTLALGTKVSFVDFTQLAEFVAQHKRAARIAISLSARDGLDRIVKSNFTRAAAETEVSLESLGRKIAPAAGSEIAFLELLDDRRYTTTIRRGGKDPYVASGRKPIRRPVPSGR